jgi:hypothetical protein
MQNRTYTIEDVTSEVRDLLHRYEEDDLWLLLESEWRTAESKVAPVRGKEELHDFLTGLVEQFRERLRVNQGIIPATLSAVTSYILSELELQYPIITPFKIPVSLLVTLVVYSVQGQFLSSE